MKRPHALIAVRQNAIFLTRKHRKPKVRKFVDMQPKQEAYRRDH